MLASAPSINFWLLTQYIKELYTISYTPLWHYSFSHTSWLERYLADIKYTWISIFSFFIYYLTLWYIFARVFSGFKIEHQIGFQQELIRNAAWCSKMTGFISGVENNHQPPDKMLANFNRMWYVHQPDTLADTQPLCDTVFDFKSLRQWKWAGSWTINKWPRSCLPLAYELKAAKSPGRNVGIERICKLLKHCNSFHVHVRVGKQRHNTGYWKLLMIERIWNYKVH